MGKKDKGEKKKFNKPPLEAETPKSYIPKKKETKKKSALEL